LKSAQNTGAASSDEEEDLNRLQTVEQKLLAHDPSFTADNTFASLSTQKSALVSAFRPTYEEGDSEGLARIHLSTERWRVCEAWFAPGMAGVDSAGLAEVVQGVLQGFSEEEKALLAQNVFLTGSPSKLPGLKERVHASLRPILPPEITLQVKLASDAQLDTWKGMAAFAKEPQFSQVGVTKAEYNELGGEIVKRWWGGNWNSSISR
jgi:actin-related protein 5